MPRKVDHGGAAGRRRVVGAALLRTAADGTHAGGHRPRKPALRDARTGRFAAALRRREDRRDSNPRPRHGQPSAKPLHGGIGDGSRHWSDHRRGAGAPGPCLPSRLPNERPLVHQLHRRRRHHANPGVSPSDGRRGGCRKRSRRPQRAAALLQPQRWLARLRPRRAPVRRHGRRRQRQRSGELRAEPQLAARQDAPPRRLRRRLPHRCVPQLPRAGDQSVRGSGGHARRDLGVWPAEPLAEQLRPRDGRSLHRRCRSERPGGNPLPARVERRRGELRVAGPRRHGRDRPLRAGWQPADRPDLRIHSRQRDVPGPECDRRLRLPRADRVPARPILLRRLCPRPAVFAGVQRNHACGVQWSQLHEPHRLDRVVDHDGRHGRQRRLVRGGCGGQRLRRLVWRERVSHRAPVARLVTRQHRHLVGCFERLDDGQRLCQHLDPPAPRRVSIRSIRGAGYR